jgi:hypothetical protein
MGLVAPVLTLVLGFLAGWVAIRPPQRTRARVCWIGAFAILTLIALYGTYWSSKDDKAEKTKLSGLVESTKRQTELLYTQNADLHAQIEHLGNTVTQAMSRPQPSPTGSACLKSDTQAQLERLNAFLKDRLAKSPAYDPKFANDPQYSAKEVAYEQETSHLYVEKFWPSTQALLQRAVAASITPEGTESLSNPAWYPEPKWWEAMLKPGYKELVLISQRAPAC